VAAKRLFICYARVDAANVEAVAAECAQLGQDVWYDQQLSGGQQWWDTILENIRDCDCFIFALSPASLHSKACRAELDYAHRLERRILPVVVGEYVPDQLLPPYVAQTQRVDPQQPHQLARALLSLEPTPPFTGALPPPPPVPISYLDELAGAVEKRQLTLPEQRNLVGDLKDRLAQEDEREGARVLLLRLRQRSDVYNNVAAEIDEVLTSLPPPTPRGAVGQLLPPPAAAPPPRRRGKTVVGVVAALLIVAGVGGAAYVISNREDTAEPTPTTAPRPTEPPSPTVRPAPITSAVVPSAPTAPPNTESPLPTDAPLIGSLVEKFPGVDFSLCQPLGTLPGRPVPIEAAVCTFGNVRVEFYNFAPQDLDTDVAGWTTSAVTSSTWNDAEGLTRGRVFEVVLANGQEGIYWTYDDDAYSALAYGDPATFVPFDEVESFWLAFDGHVF
jgi:hypothetical protein